MSMNQVVAGWYPDPDFKLLERYWDGQGWTDQNRPGQALSQPVGSSLTSSRDYLSDGSLKKYSAAAVWACIPLTWGLVGIICAIVAMGSTGANGDRRGRGAAVTGLTLNIIYLVIFVVVFALGNTSDSPWAVGFRS